MSPADIHCTTITKALTLWLDGRRRRLKAPAVLEAVRVRNQDQLRQGCLRCPGGVTDSDILNSCKHEGCQR